MRFPDTPVGVLSSWAAFIVPSRGAWHSASRRMRLGISADERLIVVAVFGTLSTGIVLAAAGYLTWLLAQ